MASVPSFSTMRARAIRCGSSCAGGWYLMRRHSLSLTGSVLLTQATVLIPQYILAEVTLSFLGLGVGEPVPSWGNMLAEARQYHALVLHTWMLAPGLATIPLVLGYLMLADALLEPSTESPSMERNA